VTRPGQLPCAGIRASKLDRSPGDSQRLFAVLIVDNQTHRILIWMARQVVPDLRQSLHRRPYIVSVRLHLIKDASRLQDHSAAKQRPLTSRSWPPPRAAIAAWLLRPWPDPRLKSMPNKQDKRA
jgi:hypothetical protein